MSGENAQSENSQNTNIPIPKSWMKWILGYAILAPILGSGGGQFGTNLLEGWLNVGDASVHDALEKHISQDAHEKAAADIENLHREQSRQTYELKELTTGLTKAIEDWNNVSRELTGEIQRLRGAFEASN